MDSLYLYVLDILLEMSDEDFVSFINFNYDCASHLYDRLSSFNMLFIKD